MNSNILLKNRRAFKTTDTVHRLLYEDLSEGDHRGNVSQERREHQGVARVLPRARICCILQTVFSYRNKGTTEGFRRVRGRKGVLYFKIHQIVIKQGHMRRIGTYTEFLPWRESRGGILDDAVLRQ